MPGMCGTSRWSSTRTGVRAGAGTPGYLEQCRQLTEARAEHDWLRAGSQTVQQQALRDLARAVAAFFDRGNPAGRPSWRKAGRDEGFRIVGRGGQWEVRRLSRKVGQVWVPKAGWVRFRWSRAVPVGVKVDAKSRKSQARFVCTACGYACHADVNAARNIAAGLAVTARGGFRGAGPANREPQLLATFTRE
jgi:transposase